MSGAEGGSDEAEAPKQKVLECPVCLQICLQPISLPCSHIFCFICAKGVASHSRKCALCRKSIPEGYLNSPIRVEDQTPPIAIEGKYQWFYRGKDGWWQYDPRVSNEIEASFKEGQMTLKVMIAGFMYIVDIEKMIQYRENIPSRVRCIKRDHIDIADKKGIAGLPMAKFSSSQNDIDANKSQSSKEIKSNENPQDVNKNKESEEHLRHMSATSLSNSDHSDYYARENNVNLTDV